MYLTIAAKTFETTKRTTDDGNMHNSLYRTGYEIYCFSSAVRTNDESQGLEEGDDVLVLRVETPDALDQHFIDSTHLVFFFFLFRFR